MSEPRPDWAFVEAARICNKGNAKPLTVEEWRRHVSFNALAAKIAEHEEPPVDPLLECLRETFGGCAPEFFNAFKAALDWRGLEIVAREQSHV